MRMTDPAVNARADPREVTAQSHDVTDGASAVQETHAGGLEHGLGSRQERGEEGPLLRGRMWGVSKRQEAVSQRPQGGAGLPLAHRRPAGAESVWRWGGVTGSVPAVTKPLRLQR